VYRINGPDELPDQLPAIVGVTAGASAPEDLVRSVIDRLAPSEKVEEIRVTEEDEYFPPPRNLRELLGAIDAATLLTFGGTDRATLDDRNIDASDVLETLAGPTP
jgi:4-hydroxy-3-methylbut-2-enyl diphosphate reductase